MKHQLETHVNVTVDVWTVDADGRHHHRDRRATHNLTVDSGMNLIRDLLNGDAVAGLTHFGLGTSSTAEAAGQTALVTEVLRDLVTSRTKSPKKLTIRYYLAAGSANGNTLREAGLFNAGSGGTMFSRVVLATPIVKTSSIAVTFQWEVSWGV